MPERPDDASDLVAPTSGFLADADTEALLDEALTNDVDVVIDRAAGSAVVRGEVIGWISSLGGSSDTTVDAVAKLVEVSELEELHAEVIFGCVALADVAIMALSPAVNDPNSAVQVIQELRFLLPQLAEVPSGPYGRTDQGGRHRVVVRANTFGEYVDVATTQIVLYGGEGPAVVRALERLVRILESLDLGDNDRAHVAALAAGVRSASSTYASRETGA